MVPLLIFSEQGYLGSLTDQLQLRLLPPGIDSAKISFPRFLWMEVEEINCIRESDDRSRNWKPEQKREGHTIKAFDQPRIGSTTSGFCVRQTPTVKPQKIPCGHFKLTFLRYQGSLL